MIETVVRNLYGTMIAASDTHLPNTRERILDAAEVLFAEHGFEATSMRAITAAAGVNLAAVNYHFGSKDALIKEIFRRGLTELNRRRLQALDAAEAEAAGAPLRPRQVVEAFFGTALEMWQSDGPCGRVFMKLLARTVTEPNEFVRTFLSSEYLDVMPRFKSAFFKSLPDVPREEILWRFHFMLGATTYALAGVDALQVVTDCQLNRESPEVLVPRLMSFLLGGLRAPLAPGGLPKEEVGGQ